MNTNHTPGPWATDIELAAETINRDGVNSGRKNDHRIDGATVYINHGSGKGGEICHLRHDPDDGLDLNDAEYQGNARLIAAAPDLLAALRKLAPLVNMAFEHEGDVFGKLHNHATDALAEAEAAITKATSSPQ